MESIDKIYGILAGKGFQDPETGKLFFPVYIYSYDPKKEYAFREALKRLEIIQDAKANTPDGDELEQLVMSIQHYELKHYALPEPTPEDVKQFYIEQLGRN